MCIIFIIISCIRSEQTVFGASVASVVSVVSVVCRYSGALRSAALALQQAPAEQQICAHKPAGIIANRLSQKLDRPPSSSLLLDIASRISAFAPSAAHSAPRSQHQQIIPRSGAHCSLLALLLRQISHSSRSRHMPPHRLPRPRSALPQPPAVMTPQQHGSALPMALLRTSHQQQRLQTSSAASRCALLASRNRRIPQLARTALAAHRDCASSHHRAAHTSYSIFISRWSSHTAT